MLLDMIVPSPNYQLGYMIYYLIYLCWVVEQITGCSLLASLSFNFHIWRTFPGSLSHRWYVSFVIKCCFLPEMASVRYSKVKYLSTGESGVWFYCSASHNFHFSSIREVTSISTRDFSNRPELQHNTSRRPGHGQRYRRCGVSCTQCKIILFCTACFSYKRRHHYPAVSVRWGAGCLV